MTVTAAPEMYLKQEIERLLSTNKRMIGLRNIVRWIIDMGYTSVRKKEEFLF